MGCKECPYNTPDKIVVRNEGQISTGIVFVGEAPGKKEVQHRPPRPFVGPTGKLLREMIAYWGFDPNVVLVNSLRCQIDKKDKPKVNLGMKHCRSHLKRAIHAVSPRIIVVLGDVALRQVLGMQKIMANRGRFFFSEEFNCPIFVMVHPSYILRGARKEYPNNIPLDLMNLKEKMYMADFQTLRGFIDNGYIERPIDTRGYVESTVASLKRIKGKQIIGLDCEAVNANVHDKANRVLSVAISAEEGRSLVTIFDKKNDPRKAEIKRIAEDETISKAVAARPFDENLLYFKEGIEIKGTCHDVLPMAHILDENYYKYSLETVTNAHIPEMQNIKDLAEGMRTDLENAERGTLLRYSGVDPDATRRDYFAMKRLLDASPDLKRYYIHFMVPIQNAFKEFSRNGCKIDIERLRHNEQEIVQMIESLHAEALELIPNTIKRKHRNKKEEVSLSQDRVIVDYLFKHRAGLRVRPRILTPKTKEPATSENHLKLFLADVPFIRIYQRWKKASKIKKPYMERLWTFLQEDGCVYPNTLWINTVTGRTVMKDPEMQTIPSRGELAHFIRDAFVAEDGWLLGSRDLSQSEMRIVGWLAQDANILKALEEGIDLHDNTAREVLAKALGIVAITPELRRKAKPVNFGFIYGQSAEGFRNYAADKYDIIFTQAESEGFRNAFFAYPSGYYGLVAYHEARIQEAEKLGYVRSPLGRRRRLPAIHSREWSEKSEAQRQAINAPVQTFSSDLGALGMKLANDEVQSHPRLRNKIKYMWFIHDEALFKAVEDKMPKAQEILKECMEVRTKEYIKKHFKMDVDYPIASDGKTGIRWSEMEKYFS